MRIAHIGGKGLPSRGGTERVIEAIAVRQARTHDVTVYGSARVCSSGTFEGIRVIAIKVPRGKYLGPVWLDIAATMHALFSPRYDIVHIHGAENTFTAPLLRLRSRVVTTNHGPAYQREKWGRVARALIRVTDPGSVRHADVPTAVAQSQAAALSARYGVRVRYIPNGVDAEMETDAVAAGALLAGNGLEPEGYALFAAARVDPTKGCLTLLRAWRILGCPMPLLVVGDLWHAPGHEAELRAAAEGMDVRFVPRTEDKATLVGLVAASDVFVFPSTVEAMSMMLLEVMALGAPVIASDIVENTQILPDSAWTFTAGDAGDLARAYRDFKAEPEDAVRERCRRRAELVAERYSWDQIALSYESAYLDALRIPDRPPDAPQ
ncbi:MAG TPA: glycosyltransferase family 4 protein [Propionibacteriaceae bacterium]